MTPSSRYRRLIAARYGRYRRLVRMYRWYIAGKQRHLELYRPDAGRAPDQDLLRAIAEDGVAIVPAFLPRSVIDQIVREVRPSIEAVAEGRYAGPLRTLRNEEEGLFRLYGVEDSLSPTSRVFFENDFVAHLADALTSTGMHSKDRYLDYKSKVGGRDPNVHYHIDHWKVRFKAFLLLQDVSQDQAPFVYVVGSHREERWRRRWDWSYQYREAAGAVLPPARVQRIRRRHGYGERVVTGNAGDLILANTRGIHRGTVLRRGTRLQLVNVFVMNGPAAYAG